MTGIFTGWSLALLLGIRHAMEPDHVAAVSTLVAERRSVGAGRAALVGALWGVGHAITLLVVGGVLLLMRARMQPWLADAFEGAVAAMLLLLGARSIRQAVRAGNEGPRHPHEHGHSHHAHHGPAVHVHVGDVTLAGRPLAIGLMHGLAGSGALTALVLASMPSTVSAVVYLVVFALGAMTGMALLTGLAGWPLARLARSRRSYALLVGTAGLVSLVLGVVSGWPLAHKWWF